MCIIVRKEDENICQGACCLFDQGNLYRVYLTCVIDKDDYFREVLRNVCRCT